MHMLFPLYSKECQSTAGMLSVVVISHDLSLRVHVSVVYSLRQRCMQVVRAVMTFDEIQNADIPETLKEDILHCYVQPPYSEYVPSGHH